MQRSPQLTSLSHDHHVVLERALQLDRATASELTGAVAAFAAFHDQRGERHLRREEEVLGPLLTPVERARLLREHAEIRSAHKRSDRLSLDEAHALGDRLRRHVRWEERELFAALEARVDEATLNDVAAELRR